MKGLIIKSEDGSKNYKLIVDSSGNFTNITRTLTIRELIRILYFNTIIIYYENS